ncbi:hypothetical protein NDU88_002695 [Pleurodeles waltl]|uniref:Uncharacterized protein n=1 Tax=Pleurodeles waltl TaxID=8319 RepID=A0AAV7UBY5_PLEWA|nr:hypothetical protein NDU88_002695 [Pleurodeles waltl]
MSSSRAWRGAVQYGDTFASCDGWCSNSFNCQGQSPRPSIEGANEEDDEDWLVADIQDKKIKAICEEARKTAVEEDAEMQVLKKNLDKPWFNFLFVLFPCRFRCHSVLLSCLARIHPLWMRNTPFFSRHALRGPERPGY